MIGQHIIILICDWSRPQFSSGGVAAVAGVPAPVPWHSKEFRRPVGGTRWQPQLQVG